MYIHYIFYGLLQKYNEVNKIVVRDALAVRREFCDLNILKIDAAIFNLLYNIVLTLISAQYSLQ